MVSSRILLKWIRQTSRCQAFAILSSAVVLVESFTCHPKTAGSRACMYFHRGENSRGEDVTWNRTATAMDEACSLLAVPWVEPSEQEEGTENVADEYASRAPAPSGTFEYTVSHDTVDYWFHLLKGMEEEDLDDTSSGGWWRRPKNAKKKDDSSSSSRTTMTGDDEGEPKSTDHWML